MGKHTTYKLGDDWDGKHDIVLPTLEEVMFASAKTIGLCTTMIYYIPQIIHLQCKKS
jgi:hypothetical protein